MMIIASGALIYLAVTERGIRGPVVTTRGTPFLDIPVDPLSLTGAATKGRVTAPVAIVEFGDFECPSCAAFASDILPAIERAYVEPGKALLAFRHFPLQRHARAPKAAEAAVCADRQGRFWDLYSLMFKNQKAIADEAALLSAGRQLGVDAAAYASCLASGASKSQVDADAKSAGALGVSGTPAFLVGVVLPDRRVKVVRTSIGAGSVAAFSALIEEALQAAGEK